MKQTFLFVIFLVLCKLSPAQNRKSKVIDDSVKKAVVNSICNALNHYYVFPDKAKLMCSHLKQQEEKGYYDSLTDPNFFADKVSRDIRKINNDKHLRIEYNPTLEKDVLKFIASKNNSPSPSVEDITKDEKRNFYFKKVEILPANIGYIEFNGFANPGVSTRKTINAAMQFVAHTDALIIDLRNNFGGNGTTGSEIGSYFFGAKTYSGRSYNRIENKWVDQYIENKKAITGGLVLNIPIYVLTSNRTFSAAEGLAYNLQHLRKAIIVGDTTRGGAHLTRSFSLGNGFVGFIPYVRGENAITKTDWEGAGVIPEIISDEINCVETAVNNFLSKKLDTTTNATERKKIAWIINYNKAKTSSILVDTIVALKYAGQYAEFEVVLQGGQLMLRDTNQPDKTYKRMVPITTHFFQVGNDYQVEFIIGLDEKCNSIKIYWNDGWEENIQRTK